MFSAPSLVSLDVSGEDIVVARVSFDDGMTEYGGGSGPYDPALELHGSLSDNGGWVSTGAQFVIESDGKVVATTSTKANHAQCWDSESTTGSLYLLNRGTGFTPCDGVSDEVLADGSIVAVAGIVVFKGDGEIGPFYAWKKTEPQK